MIERLFKVDRINDQGVYKVRICKGGIWREVLIDDFVPCFPNSGPIFSRNNQNELWVMLLEKAYAKLHGGYKTLSGGLPSQGMQDLTGCPTSSFKFSDAKVKSLVDSGKLWDLMMHFDSEGFLLAGGTPGEDMWTEKGADGGEEGGLVPGHAYSVI